MNNATDERRAADAQPRQHSLPIVAGAHDKISSQHVGARILDHAVSTPDKRAIVSGSRVLTYAELAAQAIALAGRLQALQELGNPVRVGLLAPPDLEYVVVTAACQLAGAVLVPLPPLVAADAKARMIVDSGIQILFHDPEYAAQVSSSLNMIENGRVVETLPLSGGTDFERWLDKDRFPFRPTAVGDDALSDMIYSSGTTGEPKGITQSFAARRASCVGLASMGIHPESKTLQTVGLYSNYGMILLLYNLWWGATHFVMRKFSAEAAVRIIGEEDVDMAYTPPATLIRMLEAPGFGAAVAGRSCVKICAGAPLTVNHKERCLRLWPGPLIDLYGQTETGALTILAAHQAPTDKLGSVGKAIDGVKLKIIDDLGNELAPNEEGEIAGHSSTLMAGYHQRDDANAKAFWHDEQGCAFIRTGDVGKLDQEGYLWLCDRKKDLIISGGYNIYPSDIEQVLARHPDVFEVSVVGYPSTKWGESPVAFVAPRQGSDPSQEDLLHWANARLGSMQRLARVQVLAELPNGSMGKILKRTLRDNFSHIIGELP